MESGKRNTCVRVSLCSLVILLIGGSLFGYIIYEHINPIAKPLEYVDATQPVNYSIPLYWINVFCHDERINPPPLIIVEDTILRNNAIYIRSNAGFKFHLERFWNIQSSYCIQDVEDHIKQFALCKDGLNYAKQQLQNKFNETAFFVFYTKMSSWVVKGFANLGKRFVYINRERREVEMVSNVLAHELGHTFGLKHPFNNDFQKVLDLPRVCTKESDRHLVLSTCPKSLSTCNEEPEQLDNIMDYLPEYCNRKYRFSVMQVQIMRQVLDI